MKSFKDQIVGFRIPKPKRKFNAEWQVLADEMTEYFGENCYWLFRKREIWKIRDAFRICQQKRIRSLRYLMGILKKTA